MRNKYQTLAGNTVKLGLGTFGSKVLVFLMVRFYTEHLSPADYGTADLITQTANLLIPLLSLGITDAVFRFVMDETEDAAGVFTAGLFVVLAGGARWRSCLRCLQTRRWKARGSSRLLLLPQISTRWLRSISGRRAI